MSKSAGFATSGKKFPDREGWRAWQALEIQMNLISKVAGLFALVLGIVHAEQPKLATVDMQVLFKEYHRTQVEQRALALDQARIKKEDDERMTRIRELRESVGKISKQINDPAISDSRKQALFKEGNVQQEEGAALERERNEFIQRKSRALDESKVQRMRAIFEEIRKIVEAEAKEDNYDYVFDRSGVGMGSGVPIVMYSKDSTDITAVILKNLNKDAPAKKEAGEGAEPTVKAQDK